MPSADGGPVAKAGPAAGFGTSGRREFDILDPFTRRHLHLDMMRALCVACVTIEIMVPDFIMRNKLFNQCWSTQLLWVISGICWARSSRSLFPYVGRLFSYFILGTGANWLASMVAGKRARHDGFAVIYQMWYVLLLIFFCLVTAPLRPVLWRVRREADDVNDKSIGSDLAVASRTPPELAEPDKEDPEKVEEGFHMIYQALALFGLIPLFLVAVGSVHDTAASSPWIRGVGVWMRQGLGDGFDWWTDDVTSSDFCGQMGLTFSMLWVAWAASSLFRNPENISWVLIIYCYVCRVIVVPALYGNCKLQCVLCGFELFFIGAVTTCVGLRSQQTLSFYISRYWFALPLIGALLWDPRWDRWFAFENPKLEILLRVKMAELVCVVSFLAAGEKLFHFGEVSEYSCNWLTNWALISYLGIFAVHAVLAHPLNWVFFFLLFPICWWASGASDDESGNGNGNGSSSDEEAREKRATPKGEAEVAY